MKTLKTNSFRVIPGGKERKTKKEKLLYKIFILLLVLLFAQLLRWFFISNIQHYFVNTLVAREEVFYMSFENKSLITANEQVVLSPRKGQLIWLAKEGERVAVGKPLAIIREQVIMGEDDDIDIIPSGKEETILASSAGLISYYIDGIESVDLNNFRTIIHSNQFWNIAPGLQLETRVEDSVSKGDPIIKIVDNHKWFLTTVLNKEQADSLEGTIQLEIDNSERIRIRNYEKHFLEEEEKYILIFSIRKDIDDFYKKRWVDVNYIYRSITGNWLPASVLVEENGEQGVYYIRRSVVDFLPVEVIEEDEAKVFVTGIESGQEIVENPRFVRLGQRM